MFFAVEPGVAAEIRTMPCRRTRMQMRTGAHVAQTFSHDQLWNGEENLGLGLGVDLN